MVSPTPAPSRAAKMLGKVDHHPVTGLPRRRDCPVAETTGVRTGGVRTGGRARDEDGAGAPSSSIQQTRDAGSCGPGQPSVIGFPVGGDTMVRELMPAPAHSAARVPTDAVV